MARTKAHPTTAISTPAPTQARHRIEDSAPAAIQGARISRRRQTRGLRGAHHRRRLRHRPRRRRSVCARRRRRRDRVPACRRIGRTDHRASGRGRRPPRAADSRRCAGVGILCRSGRAHGRSLWQAGYPRQQCRLSTTPGVDRGHYRRTARSHVSHEHLRLLLHDPRRAAAPEARQRPSSTPARSPASKAASSCSTTAPRKARFTRSRNRWLRTWSTRRFA